MNPNNYASSEASKRLVEAGIVLETDCVWAKIYPAREDSEWKLFTKAEFDRAYYCFDTHYPAPMMAEVLRELPSQSYLKQSDGFSMAWINSDWCSSNINPADALIDLLIYLRKEIESKSHSLAQPVLKCSTSRKKEAADAK